MAGEDKPVYPHGQPQPLGAVAGCCPILRYSTCSAIHFLIFSSYMVPQAPSTAAGYLNKCASTTNLLPFIMHKTLRYGLYLLLPCLATPFSWGAAPASGAPEALTGSEAQSQQRFEVAKAVGTTCGLLFFGLVFSGVGLVADAKFPGSLSSWSFRGLGGVCLGVGVSYGWWHYSSLAHSPAPEALTEAPDRAAEATHDLAAQQKTDRAAEATTDLPTQQKKTVRYRVYSQPAPYRAPATGLGVAARLGLAAVAAACCLAVPLALQGGPDRREGTADHALAPW